MLVSCFYQQASLPFTVPYLETPLRGSIFHSHGPGNPPLTLTFVHLPAPLVSVPPPNPQPHPSMSVKIDPFTGEQVGRFRQAPHLYPETHEFARRADCQRSCFTDWIGGGWGGMTKTTACVGEHCLRLRLEIFSGKTGFYTQWSWV